jgi:hypothetical protein
MKNSLHTSFVLRKNKLNKKGEAPVNIRIVLNNKRFDLATHRSISPLYWDDDSNRPDNKSEANIILNNYLDSLKTNILRQYNIMESLGEEMSTENLNLDLSIKKTHFNRSIQLPQ